MTREIQRLIRHGVAPVVAYAVAQGWLPEYMQGDVTEAAVLLIAVAGPLAWSWARERWA